jgi:hypothetical protein
MDNISRETFDHKQFFEKYGQRLCVECYGFSFAMTEPTIEQMYQAFKARYQAETYGNRPVEPFDATPTGSPDAKYTGTYEYYIPPVNRAGWVKFTPPDDIDLTVHDSMGDVNQ